MSLRIHTRGRSPFQQPLPPHRRQHIHGAIQPMAAERNPVSLSAWVSLSVAAICLLYFAAQLLRLYL